jgi:hypothetical protein
MNWMLGIFWLLFGAALLLLPIVNPAFPPMNIRGTDISIGWLALVFSAYNWVRLGIRYSYRRQRKMKNGQIRRPLKNSLHSLQTDQETDPNFRFEEGPPQIDEKKS